MDVSNILNFGGSNAGGLRIHPTTGNFWVGSSSDTRVAEVQPDGTLVQVLDLAADGLAEGELTGIAFDASGNPLASSARGVVYRSVFPLTPAPAVGTQQLAHIASSPTLDPLTEAVIHFWREARIEPRADRDVDEGNVEFRGQSKGREARDELSIDRDAVQFGWFARKDSAAAASCAFDGQATQAGLDLVSVMAREIGLVRGGRDLRHARTVRRVPSDPASCDPEALTDAKVDAAIENMDDFVGDGLGPFIA